MTTAAELLAHTWPLSLGRSQSGEGYDGSCPCAIIIGDGFSVDVHCWRSGCPHGCEFSGIHVTGTLDPATMRRIAEHIRDNNGWTDRTDWTITVEAI